MNRIPGLLQHRAVIVAVKAGVACGLAFYLGSLVPAPVDEYKYYAALGAFTVVGLVIVDSLKESLRVFGAVVIGVVAALVVQNVSWTNFLTVGVTVLVCSLLMALPLLGDQRTWAPLAALFVLATGGPDPEPMIEGYLVQLPLGAAVGVLVNLVVLPTLGATELHGATMRVVSLMGEQLRSYADLLDRVDDENPPGAGERSRLVRRNEQELRTAVTRLRAAVEQATRARTANPRTLTQGRRQADELRRALATNRCAAMLLAAGVVVSQSRPGNGDSESSLRRAAVDVLRRAADIYDDPDRLRSEPGLKDELLEAVSHTLQLARSADVGDGVDDVLLGALVLTIRDNLETFADQVAAGPDGPGTA